MFKIGDRVRVAEVDSLDLPVVGQKGTVIEILSDGRIAVKTDERFGSCCDFDTWNFKTYKLELIKEVPIINTQARDAVASALRECADTYAELFKVAIEAIEGADRPEVVMAAKKTLLVDIIENMPDDNNTCYFCKVYWGRCGDCPYGKHHGICTEDGSTYDVMADAIDAASVAISQYYTGETYTDEAKLQRHAEYLKLKAEFETD